MNRIIKALILLLALMGFVMLNDIWKIIKG